MAFSVPGRERRKTSLRDQLAGLDALEKVPTRTVQELAQELKRSRAEIQTDREEQQPVLKKHRSCEEDDVGDEDFGRDSDAGMVVQNTSQGPYLPLVLEDGVQVPASINSRLLEHQREGVKFLYKLYRDNKGGILGDDMGLGKTIQTIAFVSAILNKGGDDCVEAGNDERKVVLVLCPTSVIENWEREFESWGSFRLGIYHGAKRESIVEKAKRGQLDIVLTSHDTFRIHGDLLLEIEWDCMVVDEAHRLKNEKSKLYKACANIRTSRRYGLTGTVLQNKFMELFNVFDWAEPGCLGTKEHFRSFYDEPIKQGQKMRATDEMVGLAESRRSHLLRVLRKYLLRRTKDETIGHLLRGKEDIVVFCALSSVQKRVYTRLLQSPDFQCLVRKDEPCDCGSGETSAKCCLRTAPEGIIWRFLHSNSTDGCKTCPYCLVLPCLTKLQQVSNHLELLKPNPNDDEEKRERDAAFARLVFGEDAASLGGIESNDSFVGLSDAQHCGKMLALKNLLSSWTAQGDKVLVFSYSVRMLGILERFLIRKGYCFCRLDGSTPMNARQAIVDDFNSSPSKQVFLISTRAGGLGLNLVSANRVVVFDPNWNPAQDLQAQDRSFRFGQKRHVTVFRLLAAGSLEELIYTRQIYKQQLFNIAVTGTIEKRYFEGVQDSKDNKGELFGVSNLFRDLQETVFTSDIIGQYKQRQMRIEMEDINSSNRKIASKRRMKDVEDDEDEHGLSVIAQLVKAGVKDETAVEDILSDAGVLYSHRNDQVVSAKGPQLVEAAEDSENELAGTRRRAATKAVEKKVKQVRSLRVGDKIEHRHPAAAAAAAAPSKAVNDKKVQFLELASFKGMDEKCFSKWLVSASQAQREALLSEYRRSKHT